MKLTFYAVLLVLSSVTSVSDVPAESQSLLSLDYLAVVGVYLNPKTPWLQRNQSSLHDHQLDFHCSGKSFQDPELNTNHSQMDMRARSDEKFTFLYGSIDFRAKFPIAGALTAVFGLLNDRCTLDDCSLALSANSIAVMYTMDRPDQIECRLSYVDPQNNAEVRKASFDYRLLDKSLSAFHNFTFIWSRKFVTCSVDGVMIANSTNQLVLPKGKHVVNMGPSCSYASQNLTDPEGTSFVITDITYRKLPDQDSWAKDTRWSTTPPPEYWEDHWTSIPVNRTCTESCAPELSLFGYNDYAVLYVDEVVLGDRGGTTQDWIFELLSATWQHAAQRYGLSGPKGDSRLYAIFRVKENKECTTSDQTKPLYKSRNVLDCGSIKPEAWNASAASPLVVGYIYWGISRLVTKLASGIYGNPAMSVDSTALNSIILYDLYHALNNTKSAKIFLDAQSLVYHSSPRNSSYWLRDFYLPIYKNHGQSQVLNRYFALLSKNFPSKLDEGGVRRYSRDFRNLGEYVHFWSGVANASLRNISSQAFGWTLKDEMNIRLAQKEFPNIRYPEETNLIQLNATDALDIVPSAKQDTSVGAGVIVPAVVVPVVLASLLVGAMCFWRKKKRASRRKLRALTMKTTSSTVNPYSTELLNGGFSKPVEELCKEFGFAFGPDVKPFIIPKHLLRQSTIVLGRGEFGTVYAGVASGLFGINNSTPVAVKELNSRLDSQNEVAKKSFEHEVEIMVRIGKHLNIVNLLGVILDEFPTLLIELCDMGSLLSRVQDCRKIPGRYVNLVDADGNLNYDQEPADKTDSDNDAVYHVTNDPQLVLLTTDLISFSYQISRGLEYLSGRSIVHRDIAARNVLLTKDKVAKVSDFGMARWSEKNYVLSGASGTTLPVRWMAPEAISTLSFNQSTDVWSFGVTLWEVFSLGLVPYSQIPLAGRIAQFGEWLKAGNCLSKPQSCPNNVYEIMKESWTIDVAERPFFKDLRAKFEQILSNDVADYYMVLDQPYESYNRVNAHLLADIQPEESSVHLDEQESSDRSRSGSTPDLSDRPTPD